MRAARIHQFGGPEVIRIEDIPTPEPQSGEVLIRVHAASVNPVDYKIRQGGFLPEDKLPVTLGRDLSGVIERAGDGTADLKQGDAVFAMLDQDRGGNAEFAIARAEICARKPERSSNEEAAAVPLAALTAWQGLFDRGGLAGGQRVLIHGAAGGVGHFAVQFARVRGAEVFATCAGEDVEFVRGLGAQEVIDYKTQRFEDRARDIDMVYDLIGGETQDRSWSVLRPGGIIVSTLTEPDKAKAAGHGARGTHYMAQPNARQLEEIGELIASGKVRVTVDRVMPLADIAAAHRAIEHDHIRGKIVLRVA